MRTYIEKNDLRCTVHNLNTCVYYNYLHIRYLRYDIIVKYKVAFWRAPSITYLVENTNTVVVSVLLADANRLADGAPKAAGIKIRLRTFPPFRIGSDQFVDQRHIFKPLPLTFADNLRIASLVGTKQVQVEHHDCRSSGERGWLSMTELGGPGCQIWPFLNHAL